jgi:hypothetical protein
MSEPQNQQTKKAPWHFWLISIVGLLWSSMGAVDYVMTQTKNEAYMSAFTADQLAFFYSLPLWSVTAWAIGVWSAVGGCIFLLLRMRLAVWYFLASLLAIVVTAFQNYVLSNGMEVIGDTFSLVFTAVIFLVALGLYLYARAMQRRGFLT